MPLEKPTGSGGERRGSDTWSCRRAGGRAGPAQPLSCPRDWQGFGVPTRHGRTLHSPRHCQETSLAHLCSPLPPPGECFSFSGDLVTGFFFLNLLMFMPRQLPGFAQRRSPFPMGSHGCAQPAPCSHHPFSLPNPSLLINQVLHQRIMGRKSRQQSAWTLNGSPR